MRRLIAVPLALLLCACPGDKKNAAPPAVVEDTTPVNLDSLQTSIPPAAPDTFKRPKPAHARFVNRTPDAPTELVEVVEREQSFSKFCYQEFGQKVDPSLTGGVAMLVTVGGEDVTDAHVADDSWSSKAGKAVNNCLNDRAAKAWKTAAGNVRPGTYVVQLAFRPS